MGGARHPRQCDCAGSARYAVGLAAAARTNDPSYMEAMLARIPLKRLATAEEVAAAVCYLASPQAASITGQVLVMDGGLTAA